MSKISGAGSAGVAGNLSSNKVFKNSNKFKITSKETQQEVLNDRLATVYDLNKMLSEEHEERIIKEWNI